MAATAEAKDVGGNIAKMMIFSTTPTAAEGTSPNVFTMAVMTKKEILTNASCNAKGRPTFQILNADCGSGIKSLLYTGKENPFFLIYISAARKLIA